METHLEGAWRDLEVQIINMGRKLELIAEPLHIIDLKLDRMCVDLQCDLAEFKAYVRERLEASRQCRG